MIKINAGQGKSAVEITIVFGCVIGEIKPPGRILVAKTIRTSCPPENVSIEAHASLLRRSDICSVGDIELG
jgi:phage protein D